jgi:hypothetical protein
VLITERRALSQQVVLAQVLLGKLILTSVEAGDAP